MGLKTADHGVIAGIDQRGGTLSVGNCCWPAPAKSGSFEILPLLVAALPQEVLYAGPDGLKASLWAERRGAREVRIDAVTCQRGQVFPPRRRYCWRPQTS